MINKRVANLLAEGSQSYRFETAGIAATASETIRVREQFPRARVFEPLDEIDVINNSACLITLRLDSRGESWSIPSYMNKKLSDKPFNQWTITNEDAATAVAAGEVIISVKRIGAKVTFVKSV